VTSILLPIRRPSMRPDSACAVILRIACQFGPGA
jgi:hypothetical protein